MSTKNLVHVRRLGSGLLEFSSGVTILVLTLGLHPSIARAFDSSSQSTGNQAAAPGASSEKTVPEKPAPQGLSTPPGYRIGAGDELAINVWRELEASVQSVVVRPDGKITLPLVKEVDVLGLTPSELEKILVAKLSSYINHPDVTVVVREIRSKKVYLVGAVNKVGPVPLLSNMTVLQVLAQAGGITEFAKKKKIYVMRSENGKQVKLPFNYDAVVKGDHMEQNIQVLPDDTIVVPH
jgi:polysaccharide export outer membrane protein